MGLLQLERITRLGRLGEILAAERLKHNGFTDVDDLNAGRTNFPFADLLATSGGVRYLIGVKTRNEMRQGFVGLNESYNLVLVSDRLNYELKAQGKTTAQITAMLWAEVAELAKRYDATPAWITVPIRATAGTYSAYFGVVANLGNIRSVKMTRVACAGYRCLGRDISDVRVTPDLLNA
jgi:hypothetical protein